MEEDYHITTTMSTMVKSFKALDEEKNTIFDFQAEGKQCVGPGSIHPNGNPYIILEHNEIATIKLTELKAILSTGIPVTQFTDYKKKTSPTTISKDETIREIKSKLLLADYLKDIGTDTSRNPTGCPLHDSKGGKCLSYNNELWHCFHCEQGGDVIELYKVINKCDFITAKNQLANQLGIKIKPFQELTNSPVTRFVLNVQNFYEQTPFFYDRNNLFWLWDHNRSKYALVDETDLLNHLDDNVMMEEDTIKSNIKQAYLEAFRRYGRRKHPKEAPVQWVQFRDKIYDIEQKEEFMVTPEYFFTNPIPWAIGETEDTPVMDSLFSEWVGEDYVSTLKDSIAYSCFREYPIHVIICLFGSGRNGKSRFQKLLTNFVGMDNVCGTELDLLVESRFESSKGYKKLVMIMGETNFGVMKKTTQLKKMCGQDMINYEFKNRGGFNDYNYAKIFINSNSLPVSMDTSEGFYRRWLILNFPNAFPEGRDILEIVPEEEYNNLARYVVNHLPKLLEIGRFEKQGTIKERQEKYEMASNPIQIFLSAVTDEDVDGKAKYSKIYALYTRYLKLHKMRTVSRKEFSKILADTGLEVDKVWGIDEDTGERISGYFILGVTIRKEFVTHVSDETLLLLSKNMYIKEGDSSTMVKSVTPDSKKGILDDQIRLSGQRYNSFNNLKREITNCIKTYNGIVKYEDLLKNFDGKQKKYFDIAIKKLLMDGDLSQPKPGHLKVVE